MGAKSDLDLSQSASAKLERMLGFGRFQFFQVWVFSSAVCFLGSMNTLQFVYTIARNDYRCSLPEQLEKPEFDHAAFENQSNLVDSCVMADFRSGAPGCSAWTIAQPAEIVGHQCLDETKNVSCPYGYVHQTEGDSFFWSLTSEDDWVCDKAEYGSNLFMAQSVGIIFNSFLFMQLSDSWGRQPIFHITNATYIASRLIFLFIHEHYWLSLVVVALGSGFYPVGIRVAYTVIAEYTDERGRLHLYVAGWVFWVLGFCFMSFIAWATRHWFVYGLATTLPNAVLFVFWWLSPESPRLLLTQGKVDKAEQIIRGIKKWNGEDPGENLREELEQISREISGEEKAGIFSLFSSSRMLLITFLFAITWTVNDFFYIGGQMNVENLAGNTFVNFALASLTELPSVFVGEYMCNRLGRRWSHVVCMAVTTLFFAIITVICTDPSMGTTVTILALCAKTASNVGWFVNYLQNMEIFPTTARVTGMNITANCATAIGIAAPYVVLLGDSDLRLMYLIFTLLGVLGVAASSFLPESYKEEFPECIEDVERRRRYPYFSWRVWRYKKVEEEEEEEQKTDC